MADLIPQLRRTLPTVLRDAGENASSRVIEFFIAEIRNENTCKAYARAVRRFFRWADGHELNLSDIEPVHVAAYVEEDERAEPVRSPSLETDGGKTPALTAEETWELLDSIVEEKTGLPQLRDRAIIDVMTYTFDRVSAVCRLDVGDYFRAGRQGLGGTCPAESTGPQG